MSQWTTPREGAHLRRLGRARIKSVRLCVSPGVRLCARPAVQARASEKLLGWAGLGWQGLGRTLGNFN